MLRCWLTLKETVKRLFLHGLSKLSTNLRELFTTSNNLVDIRVFARLFCYKVVLLQGCACFINLVTFLSNHDCIRWPDRPCNKLMTSTSSYELLTTNLVGTRTREQNVSTTCLQTCSNLFVFHLHISMLTALL